MFEYFFFTTYLKLKHVIFYSIYILVHKKLKKIMKNIYILRKVYIQLNIKLDNYKYTWHIT
jgi:hypothetical protein